MTKIILGTLMLMSVPFQLFFGWVVINSIGITPPEFLLVIIEIMSFVIGGIQIVFASSLIHDGYKSMNVTTPFDV